jgi:hypothetical protein
VTWPLQALEEAKQLLSAPGLTRLPLDESVDEHLRQLFPAMDYQTARSPDGRG